MKATLASTCLVTIGLLAASPCCAQNAFPDSTQLGATQEIAMTPSVSPGDVAIRHPYMKAFVRDVGVVSIPSETAPAPVLNRLHMAAPWIKLLSEDALRDDWERSSCDAQGRGFCKLRWRKSDAFSNARSRWDEASTGMKALLVGKALADHMDVDIDSSPEIKFEWEFD